MPRIKRGLETPQRSAYPDLVDELAKELTQHDRACGQPRIEEEHFQKTNLVKVTVIWDKWDHVRDEDRSAVILEAYERAEGTTFRDRIALAIGLTVPEALEMGLLPYEITTALRKGDPVTLEQCKRAMSEAGASTLFGPGIARLRLGTKEEVDDCLAYLRKRLPGSDDVWLVSKDFAPKDQ